MDDDGLAELHSRFPPPDPAENLRRLRKARTQADRAAWPEPTVIPESESPDWHCGVIRFPCPLRCGWYCEEPTDTGPVRLILPAGFTSAGLDEMLTLNAEARHLALLERVGSAIRDHYARAHPGR